MSLYPVRGQLRAGRRYFTVHVPFVRDNGVTLDSAEVIRGNVPCPSEMGDLAVGGVDIVEYLYELKDQEVMLIVAHLGAVEEPPTVCGLCRTPYDGDECPTCRQEREDAKRVIEERLRLDREPMERPIEDARASLEGRRAGIGQG